MPPEVGQAACAFISATGIFPAEHFDLVHIGIINIKSKAKCRNPENGNSCRCCQESDRCGGESAVAVSRIKTVCYRLGSFYVCLFKLDGNRVVGVRAGNQLFTPGKNSEDRGPGG